MSSQATDVFYGGRMLSTREADHLAAEKANKEAKNAAKKGCPKKN